MEQALVVGRVDVVGEVDEELGETTFGGGVVAQHRRESGIPERFGASTA